MHGLDKIVSYPRNFESNFFLIFFIDHFMIGWEENNKNYKDFIKEIPKHKDIMFVGTNSILLFHSHELKMIPARMCIFKIHRNALRGLRCKG